jgi:hypothetical protein
MLKRYLFFPWLVLSALAAAGCGGPDFEAICDEQEKCSGGNEKDLEACVVAFEGFADVADDIGCTDEFDAYFTCSQEHASCRDVPTGDTCMTDGDCNGPPGNARCSAGMCVAKDYGFDPTAQNNPCETEENAYQRCF